MITLATKSTQVKWLSVILFSFSIGHFALALDTKNKTVTIDMDEEPRSMDPQKAQDTVAFMVLGHIFEGLTRLNPEGKVVPALAESWQEVSPKEYLYKLRKNAKWSDGKSVTAHDFVYAWQRSVDPKVASLYAFIMFPVKNAEAINKGQMTADKLGVTAVDDHTLKVELERPTPYLTYLTAFGTFYPARKDFTEKQKDKYGADADKLLYNGAYVLASWKHNASMKLTKNPNYWNKDNIAINEINMPYLIRDDNSEYNMFKDGKFDLMRTLPKEYLPDAQKNKFHIHKYNVGTIWYLQFNMTRKITSNKNIRKAFQYALNRNEFITQVVGIPGTKPSYHMIPDYMPGIKATYGKEYRLSYKDSDIAKAKEYLQKGLKELNLTQLPKLGILINDAETHKRNAEYLQNYYKKTLGVDLAIDVQTFKVRLERTTNKEYDIVISGWGPDYLDVMTFADLFCTWNTNNDTGWNDNFAKEYDKKIQTAMTSSDQKARLDAVHEAQKILVEEAPVLPLFQAVRVYVQNPKIVGVMRHPVGPEPDFYYAKIVEEKK